MLELPKDRFSKLIFLYNKNKFTELASKIIFERLSYPSSLALLNLQGAVYIKLKKFNLAHQSHKSALQINNNSADILHNYGYLLKLEGKTSEAIKYFKKAIKINPNYDEAFNNLGVCYHHKGDFNKAIQNYKRVIKILENNQIGSTDLINFSLVKTLLQTNEINNYKQSIYILEELVKTNPRWSYLWRLLAKASGRINQKGISYVAIAEEALIKKKLFESKKICKFSF